MKYRSKTLTALAVVTAMALPCAVQAQTMGYGGSDAGGSGGEAESGQGAQHRNGRGVHFSPYIEASQVALAELSPGNDVLTYTSVAAGIDASVSGRHNAATVSLRYEHRFGWGKRLGDSDSVSGVARGYTTITPGVQFEAGGLAARTRVERSGAAVLSPLSGGSDVTNIYSVYAGPAVSTHAGDVDVNANYRIGYTKVDSPNSFVTTPGQPPVDVFNRSIVHNANVHAGVKPGTVLPVGLGVGGSYYQEDVSNLDQRIRDVNVRGDVTLPVSPDLALVAGVGYEDVKVSSRDAVFDASGNPVITRSGRFLTDKSKPRTLAYNAEGITWDAGVIYRPSRRTAFEAHVGRRYGTMNYYGSFAYAPNARSSINLSVYDSISGLGGRLNQALADLPTDFQANRNALTGDIGGCVASLQKGSCFSNVLGSVRSSVFRSRGVMGTYSATLGHLGVGVGAGYDRRKFIAAPGTVLAAANGTIDENVWLSAYLGGKIDRNSSFSTNVYANWFQSGSALNGDATAMGASASYNRLFGDHLSATAALGIDGVSRDTLPDSWAASALLGLRYAF